MSLMRDRGMYHSLCVVSVQAATHSCWIACQSSACRPTLNCLHSRRIDVRTADVSINYKYYSGGVRLTSGRLTVGSYRREGAQVGTDQTVTLRAVVCKAPPYEKTPGGRSSPIIQRPACIARIVRVTLPCSRNLGSIGA